jgi:hypothetical protein
MWHTMTTPHHGDYVWWVWDGTWENGHWVRVCHKCEAEVSIELSDCSTTADDMVYAVCVEEE